MRIFAKNITALIIDHETEVVFRLTIDNFNGRLHKHRHPCQMTTWVKATFRNRLTRSGIAT